MELKEEKNKVTGLMSSLNTPPVFLVISLSLLFVFGSYNVALGSRLLIRVSPLPFYLVVIMIGKIKVVAE